MKPKNFCVLIFFLCFSLFVDADLLERNLRLPEKTPTVIVNQKGDKRNLGLPKIKPTTIISDSKYTRTTTDAKGFDDGRNLGLFAKLKNKLEFHTNANEESLRIGGTRILGFPAKKNESNIKPRGSENQRILGLPRTETKNQSKTIPRGSEDQTNFCTNNSHHHSNESRNCNCSNECKNLCHHHLHQQHNDSHHQTCSNGSRHYCNESHNCSNDSHIHKHHRKHDQHESHNCSNESEHHTQRCDHHNDSHHQNYSNGADLLERNLGLPKTKSTTTTTDSRMPLKYTITDDGRNLGLPVPNLENKSPNPKEKSSNANNARFTAAYGRFLVNSNFKIISSIKEFYFRHR